MFLRWSVVITFFLALLTATVFGWRSNGIEGTSWIYGIAGGFVTLAVATLTFLRPQKRDFLSDNTSIDNLHRRAAAHIARITAGGVDTGRIDPQTRIPVRLSAVGPPSSDHWENITGQSKERLDILLSSSTELPATYRRIPTGRLVILGDSGFGKSTLLRALVEDMLRQINDTPSDRTLPSLPVILDLRTWNTDDTPFRDWLIDESSRAYPVLAAKDPYTGDRQAVLLMDEGRLLPLLDNLDQLSLGSAAAALSKLPRDPLVIASQNSFYLKATRKWRTIPGAAVLKVERPEARKVFEYLRRAGPADDAGRSLWEPTIALLASSEGHKQFGPLIKTLQIPLFAYLAALTYIDATSNPTQLTKLHRPTTSAVRAHLTDAALDAFAAGQRAPEIVRGRLALLARLAAKNDDRIAWWSLSKEVPRWFHWLVNFLIVGFLAGATTAATSYTSGNPFFLTFIATIVQFGLIVTLLSRFRSKTAPAPQRLHLRVTGRRRQVVGFLAVGALAGISVTLILTGLLGAGPAALIGFSTALTTALTPLVSRKVDVEYVSSPRRSLRFERQLAIFQATAIGLTSGAFVGLRYNFFGGMAGSGIEAGLTQGLIGGIGMFVVTILCSISVLSIWGDWLKFRMFTALSSRLPWRLLPFLEDACGYGILRQAGAFYEFRHRHICDRLLAG
ncbi:NACHT domain-containing protein [Micromonospora echinofusca]|uniref:hypothetical protein n=1 Tax=Micromonospora echinofusca TaxID=47858 RepID=UPI0012FE17CE|nr:hypothetical protein [Micromonospora echinofusca]